MVGEFPRRSCSWTRGGGGGGVLPACEGDTTPDPSSLASLEGGAPAVRSRGASCVWRVAATQLVTSDRISARTAELSDDSDAGGDWGEVEEPSLMVAAAEW